MPLATYPVEIRLVVLSLDNKDPCVLLQNGRLPVAQFNGDLRTEVLGLIEKVTGYKINSINYSWFPFECAEVVLDGDTLVLPYGMVESRQILVVPDGIGLAWHQLYQLDEGIDSQVISNVMRSLCC